MASRTFAAILVSTALFIATPAIANDGEIDFNRDIRPILSSSCFTCHGPDEDERKAELRLDTRVGAIADLGDGAGAVVPGDPDASELMGRVTAESDRHIMPPPEAGDRLTEEQIATLRQWIAEGAVYAEHWAYVQPQRPAVPEVSDGDWPQTAVDHFILRRLEAEHLQPSPQADRYALIRRVALDLTGLPPTVAEVDAFVADEGAGAYERMVDRMLAKPAFGEHWARFWLDMARYADSAGYADDIPRTIWGYRDWVIRALNDNMPFDQFTIEQLAGDLLEDPTDQQLVATAFHRNTQTNNEGGSDAEEYRSVAVVDRLNTTFEVWMGTTMACAQCHTHKYDPITLEEYFQAYAFFNQSADNNRRDEAPVHTFYLQQEKEREAWKAEIAALERTLRTPNEELLAGFERWHQRQTQPAAWRNVTPAVVTPADGAGVAIQEDGTVVVERGAEQRTDTVEIPLEGIDRFAGLRLRGEQGHTDHRNFVVTAVRGEIIPPAATVSEPQPVEFAAAFADYSQPRFQAGSLLEADGSGWAVGGGTDVPRHLTLTVAEAMPIAPGSTLRLIIEQQSPYAFHTLKRFGLEVTDAVEVINLAAVPQPIVDLLTADADTLAADQRELLLHYYLAEVAEPLAPERERLATLQKAMDEMPKASVPVMRELPEAKQRTTRIQYRGNFLDLGPEVSADVPDAFPALPEGEPRNRLTLARWLVSDENPLTARVTVNRFWEQIFGTGIVGTSEEFGSQGDLPTHPDLLDWLAVDFMENGWDIKHLLRTIVTSAAYRQSSRVDSQLLDADPDNRLLARGPRIRLNAEAIRDSALASAGLLSDKMYGPSVRPPQPNVGLSAAFGGGIDWQTSEGEDRYRRGLYTTWRRSNPYPSMATFNAPSREICIVNRDRTNTPLQALVTLNDPVFVEAAQGLARRMIDGADDAAARATLGFRIVLARHPEPAEVEALVALHADAYDEYADQPEQANAMATDPLGPLPDGADTAEYAAWTVVANVLLNLDEALMKR
ncbi:MAG: PSD1 and planctomycete cytochrome C domain-containing protein [Phycisphaeraceae bacterium]